MPGWIKLHRDITNHWLWKNQKKFQWWIEMLMAVNHESTKVEAGYQLFKCSRGQSIRSLETWGKQWGVSKDIVRHFFRQLENDGMINVENLGKTTRITICNYDKYQGDPHDTTSQSHFNLANNSSHSYTNKNDNNAKNEKKEKKKSLFMPPSLEEVIQYFDQNGYLRDSAEKAFNYYSVGDWKDKNGNPVKNWKQKMNSVWFKPENRKFNIIPGFGQPGRDKNNIK